MNDITLFQNFITPCSCCSRRFADPPASILHQEIRAVVWYAHPVNIGNPFQLKLEIMKSKITLILLTSISLFSFSSCAIWVRDPGQMHHGRWGHHEHGDRDYVQPPDNGLQHSLLTPSILQPSEQVPLQNNTLLTIN